MVLLVTMLTMSFMGCEKQVDVVRDEITLDMSQPVKITDDQIIKELSFLRDMDMITSEDYQIMLRRDDIPSKDNDLEYSVYPASLRKPSDIAYSRAMVQNLMKDKVEDEKKGVDFRHRRHTYMYSGGTITLRVKQAASSGVPVANQVPAAWINALTAAVNEWNALPYNVTFVMTVAADNSNPGGVVNVFVDNTGWGGSNIATTNLPSSAEAFGNRIMINSAYTDTPLTVSAKKFSMAHELAHVVGLQHTDNVNGSDVAASISCYGSTSYTDAGSILKASIVYNEPWAGFTICDLTVFDYYW